ncbi:ly6/PLAUR domain-containing protein 2 [Hyperolius riggenbachi]|uniref:ly6/PLAUR domain-containing protein 2 n=1 Tax=Hyperolius riggenbachi TaxID=752182 RepID=UPI0035A36BB2
MGGTGLICLSAVIFCLQPVLCLECFVCPSPTANLLCTARTNCSDSETWCFTNVYGPAAYPFLGNRTVTRGCASQCQETSKYHLGITKPTLCCQSDLCNMGSEVSSASLTSWHAIVIGITTATVLHNWA